MKPSHLRTPAAPITPAQITTIKMGQRALGIDDETYRDTLWVRYRAASCKDLTQEQAADLIQDYIDRGFVLVQPDWKQRKKRQSYPKRPARGNKKVIALATRAEIDKVNAIAALIEWRVEDGLQRFLAARMGIKDGKVRTSEDAYLAIEGLKKLFENHMKKTYGEDWWGMDFGRRDIHEYILLHRPRK